MLVPCLKITPEIKSSTNRMIDAMDEIESPVVKIKTMFKVYIPGGTTPLFNTFTEALEIVNSLNLQTLPEEVKTVNGIEVEV